MALPLEQLPLRRGVAREPRVDELAGVGARNSPFVLQDQTPDEVLDSIAEV